LGDWAISNHNQVQVSALDDRSSIFLDVLPSLTASHPIIIWYLLVADPLLAEKGKVKQEQLLGRQATYVGSSQHDLSEEDMEIVYSFLEPVLHPQR